MKIKEKENSIIDKLRSDMESKFSFMLMNLRKRKRERSHCKWESTLETHLEK